MRKIAMQTTCRGYSFTIFIPFTGSINKSTPDELIINGHPLTDEELARGYYDEQEENNA